MTMPPPPLLRLLFATGTLALCANAAAPAPPVPAPPAPPPVTPAAEAPAAADTADLLRRFASDDWKQRRAAEQDLVRLGQQGRPVIEDLLKRVDDVGTRARLEGALRQIEELRRSGTSFITLHLKDATPGQVVEEIAKQAYAPIRLQPENLFDADPAGNGRKRDVDLDRVPFWQAVQQFAADHGLVFIPGERGLQLSRAGAGRGGQAAGPAVIDGPFLVVANALNRNLNLPLAANALAQPAQPPAPPGQPAAAAAAAAAAPPQVHENFGVQFSAFAEPKLAVLRCDSVVNVEEATDDNGNSLVAEPGRQFGGGYYNGGSGVWSLHARLRYPPKNAGKTITRLRGSVTFLLQTASQSIEIADILNVKPQQPQVFGGVQLTVSGMTKAPEGHYDLKLSVGHDVLQQLSWGGVQQSMQTDLKVLDADGRPLSRRGMSTRGDNDRIEFTLHFNAGRRGNGGNGQGETGPPAKLVWQIPTETKQRVVRFEFKDLPMP